MHYRFLSTTTLLRAKYFSSYFASNKTIGVNKIGEYSLIKDFTPSESLEAGRVGLYLNDKGEKVIIKKHSFVAPDVDCVYLQNEASMLHMLNIFNNDKKIVIPKLLDLYQDGNSIQVITTFEHGDNISRLDEQSKLDILKKSLRFLNELSKKISKSQRSKMLKKDFMYFILVYKYYFFKNFIKNPTELPFYIKISFAFYWHYLKSNPLRQRLTIAHGGLYEDSILYNKISDKITLVDWESAHISDKLYDLSLVCRYYFQYLNTSNIKKLQLEFITTRRDFYRFISLSIFNCMEELSSRNFNPDHYKEVKKYLKFIFSLKFDLSNYVFI